MTISTTANAVTAQGNGAVTAFSFSFLMPALANAVVTLTDSSGNQTVLNNTQFSISGLGNPNGGVLNYPLSGSPLASGYSITLQRVMPLQQLTSLVNQSGYFPAVVESALDALEMQIQQINALVGNSIKLLPSLSGVSNLMPVPVGSNVIGWNSAGTALQNYSAASLAATITYASWHTDVFSGNGVQTAFTLSNDPGSVNNCDVIVAGVPQIPGIGFTVSGTTITFTAAPASGTNNVSVRYGNALTAIPAGVVSGSSRTVPINVSYAATVTVDASLSNVFYIAQLTGNTTLAINNPSDGQTINIRFLQDATGGRAVNLPASVSVVGSLITTANYVDWLTLTYVASASRWEGCWANATTTYGATGIALMGAATAAAARATLGAGAAGETLFLQATVKAARDALLLTADWFKGLISSSKFTTGAFGTYTSTQGSGLNASTGVFTVPTAGKYLFYGNFQLTPGATAGQFVDFGFVSTGTVSSGGFARIMVPSTAVSGVNMYATASWFIDLNAGDTVYAQNGTNASGLSVSCQEFSGVRLS